MHGAAVGFADLKRVQGLAPCGESSPPWMELMIRTFLLSTFAILAVGCQTAPKSAQHAAWSYEGHTGPAHWGDLKPEYALAKTGRSQSPIDIDPYAATSQAGPALSPAYAESSIKILNNGHTIEAEYEGGGTLTVDGRSYGGVKFAWSMGGG